MEETFTIDELLIALQGAQVAPDATGDALRMVQLIEMTGLSELSIARRIRALKAEGRVEHVRVPFERIDGVVTKVSAYRLVKRGQASE